MLIYLTALNIFKDKFMKIEFVITLLDFMKISSAIALSILIFKRISDMLRDYKIVKKITSLEKIYYSNKKERNFGAANMHNR